MPRGQLRIYIGAAPGVGKTYAMLNEGWRRRQRGTDVVVGFVETHARANTAAQIRNLEVVPRRHIEHKGRWFEEMDLAAVVERRPDVALVDELAHTNVPGSENEKRWQDVEVLLESGIDVISTLNIQHLESLNDVLAEITGITQSETIPDGVVRAADQIELVDMTPEALRRRMAHGNVYPPERVDTALSRYFRPGNLGALREIALLWVADRVDEFLDRYRDEYGITKPWETRERVVVAITGAPGGEQLIRRAARMAERSHGELIGVHVLAGDGLAEAAVPEFGEQRELLEQLGGAYHEVVSPETGQALVNFARSQNATQLVLGATRRTRWRQLTHGSVINSVIRESGSIDVHVISYSRQGDGSASKRRPQPLRPRAVRPPVLPLRRRIAGFVVGAAGIIIVTLILANLRGHANLVSDAFVYLLLVVVVAATGGFWPALATATAGFLCLNWYFTPPVHKWTVASPENLFALFTFLLVAVSVSSLVSLAARRRLEAERAGSVAEALATLAAVLMRREDPMPELVERLLLTFVQDGAALLRREETGAWKVEACAGSRPPDTPESADLTVALDESRVLALYGPPLSAEDYRVLSAFTAQFTLALQSRRLHEEAGRAQTLQEADALRTALLNAVSHDLRSPLASIKAAVTGLLESDVSLPPEAERELLGAIDDETDRLDRLVGNLLDMSRIESGTLAVTARPVGIEEVVASALESLPPGSEGCFDIDVPETLQRIAADPPLLERSIANVLENALNWSPPGATVQVTAGESGGQVVLRVIDRGPGIPLKDRRSVLRPFQRLGDSRSDGAGVGLGMAVAKGFVDLFDGVFELDDTPGGGLTVTMSFPGVQT